jgi:hypothetical protein
VRLLFRGHCAFGHQVDRRCHEKDRRCHETTRRLSLAISRIGNLLPHFFNLSAICGAKQEITVTNVKRRFRFGMNCANCDNELIAPEWSEYRYERQIRHVWRCWKCDSCFETIVETQVTEDAMTSDEIFPSGKHSGDSGTIAQQVSWPARACAPAGVSGNQRQ